MFSYTNNLRYILFSTLLFLFFLWLLRCAGCGILVPWPGIEPVAPALHWECRVLTTGCPGSPHCFFFFFFFKIAMAIVLFWSQHYHIFDSVSLSIQQLFRLCEKETFLLWLVCPHFKQQLWGHCTGTEAVPLVILINVIIITTKSFIAQIEWWVFIFPNITS